MAAAVKVQILGEDGNAAKVNSAGALEVDATLTPSGTQDVNLTQVASAAVTAGAGAVAAGTQRTTLASNDPAVVALQIMDDWDESDRAKVNPIAGQAGVQGGSGGVSALTQRVVLATDVALPAGTNTIGATQDAGPSQTVSRGVSGAAVLSADATTAVAVTDAPTSGQKIVVLDVFISVDTAGWYELEIETAATVSWRGYLPAYGSIQLTPRGKWKLATADKKLMVQAQSAGNVAVTAFYYSEA